MEPKGVGGLSTRLVVVNLGWKPLVNTVTESNIAMGPDLWQNNACPMVLRRVEQGIEKDLGMLPNKS